MKEREIFISALEHGAGAERDAFLDEACAGDSELRGQVERLLLGHARPGPSFLDEPVAPKSDGVEHHPGEWIDRYKLLEQIGEGGFGTVWMAEQKEPVRRKVAVKVLKAGMDTKQVVARFEAERQALALMDHPGIASVIDGGATQHGRPWFAMELVRGRPITEYCDAEKLDTVVRLELFRDVCQAVQHAHNKGVIHRDIKPSNVMVTEVGGRPTVKVIDFGIAKATSSELTQRTLFTEFRQLLGTPEYMAPEQSTGGAMDVDTRVDVYSLGVLLYELLTGTRPFDLRTALDASWDEMLRVIREEEPPLPSTRVSTQGDSSTALAAARHASPKQLGRLFKQDLDWIVLKSLEKDRERRYSTAVGFADDIGRYLASEPVMASPPSRRYRLRKLMARNRKTFAFASVLVVALLAGTAGTTYGMLRARNAERVAATQRDEAQRQARIAESTVAFLNDDLLASIDPASSRGREVTVREVLDNAARTVEAATRDEPELEAAIRTTLGKTYRSLGEFGEAEVHLRAVLQAAGEEVDRDSLRARSYLADLESREGHFDEHISELEDVIEAQSALLGRSDGDTLLSRGLLGSLLTSAGRHGEAEEVLVALEEDVRTAFGDGDRNTFAAQASLASLYLQQSRFEDAEALFRVMRARQAEVLGEDHPSTLSTLGSVAWALYGRKRFEESLALYRQQLAIRGRVFGAEHPSTIVSMRMVATLLSTMGRPSEAEPIFRKVLGLQRRLFGPEAVMTLLTMNNLAVCLDRQGKYAESLELLEDLSRRQEQRLGPRNPSVLITRCNIGKMLWRLGRLEEAESVQGDVLAIRRQEFGPDHHRTMESVEGLLEVLRSQPERAEEARPLQEAWIDHKERASAHPEAGLKETELLAWELLIAVPEDLRDPARALRLIEDVLSQTETRDPEWLDTYARALFMNGMTERAIEVQREAIDLAPDPSGMLLDFRKRLEKMQAAIDEDR